MSAEDISVQLTRIEGMLGVTNERLSNVQTDIADVRRVQHSHSDRLGILEADKNRRDGERKGIIASGRIVWALIGTIPGGVVTAAVMKLFGV